jgi:putative resolvase
MNKFLSIQDAAKCLGVSPQTLRRWEKKKKIAPSHRTEGGQRRFTASQLQPISCRHNASDRLTIAYARVSSHDQKEDLQRQVHMLEMYCASKGWSFSIEEELAKDVLEIITVFSARLYGSRSHKNKQLMANLQKAVADV